MTVTAGRASAIQYETVLLADVMVRMRDGTLLATDVYLPAENGKAASGRFPAILERTPYGKDGLNAVNTGRYFASRGYACIFQDIRGRGNSEGVWGHFFNGRNETEDGYGAAQWLRGQPWSNGEFGTIGVSYVGSMQQALAVGNPPGLKAQFLIDCGYNYHTHGIRSHGGFYLALYMPFFFRMALQDKSIQGNLEAQQELSKAIAEMPQWLRRLPLKKGESPLRFVPKYEELLLELASHGDYDAFWKTPQASLEEHIEQYPDVPLYFLTSWYGYHIWANAMKFNRLGARFKSPLQLTVGTWLHGFDTLEEWWAGDVDFGLDAAFSNVNDARLQWFDRFLKGVGTGPQRSVKVFLMGGGSGRRNAAGRLSHGGRWLNGSKWPLPEARETKYYLHGDGRLDTVSPAGPHPDLPHQNGEGNKEDWEGGGGRARKYRFDPRNPVPSIGGGGSPASGLFPAGAWDQVENAKLNPFCPGALLLAERPDVLVYQSEPLEQEVTVVGPVMVSLWVSSSAPDTDFMAKLIDVYPGNADYPNGYAMNLCDGMIRTRYRDRRDRGELLEPGKVYELTLNLQGTANVFAKGHRIRLDVTSSNFPQVDVNPNTGKGLWEDGETRVAEQTVWCEERRASCVVLPVR